MNELNQLLDGIAIPRMLRVRQEFDAAHIDRQDISSLPQQASRKGCSPAHASP